MGGEYSHQYASPSLPDNPGVFHIRNEAPGLRTGDEIFRIKETFYLSTSVPERRAFLIRSVTGVLYEKLGSRSYETIGLNCSSVIIKSTKKNIPKFVADSRFVELCQLVRVREICHGGRLFLYPEGAVILRVPWIQTDHRYNRKDEEKNPLSPRVANTKGKFLIFVFGLGWKSGSGYDFRKRDGVNLSGGGGGGGGVSISGGWVGLITKGVIK